MGPAWGAALSAIFQPTGQRAVLRCRAWAGASFCSRQRPGGARRDRQQLGAGSLASGPPGSVYGTLEDRIPAPPAVLVVGGARLDASAAVAVPAMGRDRGTGWARSHLRASPGRWPPLFRERRWRRRALCLLGARTG